MAHVSLGLQMMSVVQYKQPGRIGAQFTKGSCLLLPAPAQGLIQPQIVLHFGKPCLC